MMRHGGMHRHPALTLDEHKLQHVAATRR